MHWWMHLQPGDRGTWVSGIATFLTLAVTLIITTVNWIRQRSQSLDLQREKQKLQEEEQNAARRAHAEKFSCWASGRVNSHSPATRLRAYPGDLVVTLINASEQPFTETVVELPLTGATSLPLTGVVEGADTKEQGYGVLLRFKISAVPPGTSWFAFHSDGKPATLLLLISFLDNGMRSWSRSVDGALVEITKEQRLQYGQGAGHVWIHDGNPVAVLALDDAWA
jgi:hypothetical protein